MSRNANNLEAISPDDEPVYPTPISDAKPLLGKSSIFGKPIRLKTQDIDVEEWGGTLRLRELTANERTDYSKRVTKFTSSGNAIPTQDVAYQQALLIMMAAVDENMERVFDEKDVDRLRYQPSRILDAVYAVATSLSGFGKKPDESTNDLKKIPDDSSRSD